MFILEAPQNLPEDLTLLYENTARAASIAHAMHLAMADPSSTFTLETLPPNVDRLSEAVQQSKAGLRRLESELNPLSGCRTHSNFHVAAITEADRILAATGRILLASAGIESSSPTDPAEVRRYFQGVPSFDLYSLVGAMRQELCDAAVARERKATVKAVPEGAADYVTLDQMAAIVNRSKRSLERLKRRKINPLPNPDCKGRGGRADEWLWSKVRPWLEQEFGKRLPDQFPAHRH